MLLQSANEPVVSSTRAYGLDRTGSAVSKPGRHVARNRLIITWEWGRLWTCLPAIHTITRRCRPPALPPLYPSFLPRPSTRSIGIRLRGLTHSIRGTGCPYSSPPSLSHSASLTHTTPSLLLHHPPIHRVPPRPSFASTCGSPRQAFPPRRWQI